MGGGADAVRKVLIGLMGHGVVVFSSLLKDAALFDLPAPSPSGQRGRPCIYGKSRLNLTKRAGKKSGWGSLSYICRGQEVTYRYKNVLVTTKLISGVIRVVIVKFKDGVGHPISAPTQRSKPGRSWKQSLGAGRLKHSSTT